MNNKITKQQINKFLGYYKPHRKIFAIDLTFSGISAIATLLFPLVSGYITGQVLSGFNEGTIRKLIYAGILLLIITIVKIISNVLYGWFGHAMGAKMEATMREELFEHYEALSFDFHANNSVGKLMTVISNDLTDMTELFHHAPEDILATIVKLVGVFIILINIDVPLTLIMFAALPIVCALTFHFDKKMEKVLLKNRSDLGAMNEHIEDSLSGLQTIKAYGNEALNAQAFAHKNRIFTESKCKFFKIEAFFYETLKSYPQVLTMLTVFFGALFISNGSLNIPVLVTFLLYVETLAEPIRTALNFMSLYENGKAAFIRFMNMIETEPTIKECSSPVLLHDKVSQITFQNVSFAYSDGAENVLEDISLTINSNQTVAFVGASGIGKTTLSMLVARFYDATEGAILFDGEDIKNISFESLRKHIGLVQQEVHIFNGTIMDNILIGNPDASKEEVMEAAKKANIHEFICSLSDGYDSLVGTRGIKLSGGQRQRISIARLFLKDPQILILDEATSALDYRSEVIVQKSIEELMKNRTAIVIAHRLSTIKNADKIFVLANKTIAEQGTHRELIAKDGIYAKLCELGSL